MPRRAAVRNFLAVTAADESPDPYDPVPTLWQRHPDLGWGLAVFALTLLLTVAAFPSIGAGEAAYVLVAPAALWAYHKPSFKPFAVTVLGAQVVAWTIL